MSKKRNEVFNSAIFVVDSEFLTSSPPPLSSPDLHFGINKPFQVQILNLKGCFSLLLKYTPLLAKLWPDLDLQLCDTQAIWGSNAGRTTSQNPGRSFPRWVHHPAAETGSGGHVAWTQQDEMIAAITPCAASLGASPQREVTVPKDFTRFKGGLHEPLPTTSLVSPQQIRGSNIGFKSSSLPTRQQPGAPGVSSSVARGARHLQRARMSALLRLGADPSVFVSWRRTVVAQQSCSILPTGRFNSDRTAGRKRCRRRDRPHLRGCETETRLLSFSLSLPCRANMCFPMGLLTALPGLTEKDLSFLHFVPSETIFYCFSASLVLTLQISAVRMFSPLCWCSGR